MAKLSIVSLLSSFFIVSSLLPLAYSQSEVINIRFYIIANSNVTNPQYGDVYGFHDPLSDGPTPDSALVGRVQGTFAFTTLDASFDLHVSLAYIFTSGRYNGSTVVAVGRNDMTQPSRQFAIVGGTGAFRLARGIVTGTTYSDTPPIFIYDLEIILDTVSRLRELK